MKYLIPAILLAVSYSIWVLSEVPQPRSAPGDALTAPVVVQYQEDEVSEPKTMSDPTSAPASENQAAKVQAEIDRLANDLANVDQELLAIGYPKVMLDERLSESERNRIIDKVVMANRLHSSITLLNLKKLDL